MPGKHNPDLPPGCAAAHANHVALGIDDVHVGQPGEVDYNSAIIGAEAGEAVPAAANSQREPGVRCESDRCPHTVYTLRTQNVRRMACGKFDIADQFVFHVARLDDVAVEASTKHLTG
jgi:hypothetical protein